MNLFEIWIFLCLLAFVRADKVIYLNQYLVKINEEDLVRVQDDLQQFNLSFQEKIIPGIFMFKLNDDDVTSQKASAQFLQNLTSCCNGKIQAAEQVVESIKSLWTQDEETTEDDNSWDHLMLPGTPPDDDDDDEDDVELEHDNEHGDESRLERNDQTYEDIGILDVWSRNYTGKGIVIGVTDVGLDVHHEDLAANINSSLCFNAITGSKEVAPEHTGCFEQYHLSDHGTNCAGLIVGEMNTICGDGVAYEATVAGLKVFQLGEYCDEGVIFSPVSVARGLSHHDQDISIYSNSWNSRGNFDETHVNLASHQALRNGVKRGRGGKGSIFVFPAGGLADGYANSPFTVTVNAVGAQRQLRNYSESCACVITSTYGEGCTSRTKLKAASSYNNTGAKCTHRFKGTSATTAIVSGIIALALEANGNLSWRDVQYLLVESSRTTQLPGQKDILTNGAGKKYHPQLGFGMLNASRMVELALEWEMVPEQICHQHAMHMQHCSTSYYESTWICPGVDVLRIEHVSRVEHVIVDVLYDTPNERWTELVLKSPNGTRSVLMEIGQSKHSAIKKRNATFLSVHFWGETVVGLWEVLLGYKHKSNFPHSMRLLNAKLTFCGTKPMHTHQPENASVNRSRASRRITSESPVDMSTDDVDIDDTQATYKLTNQLSSGSTVGIVFGLIALLIVLGIAFSCWRKHRKIQYKHVTNPNYSSYRNMQKLGNPPCHDADADDDHREESQCLEDVGSEREESAMQVVETS